MIIATRKSGEGFTAGPITITVSRVSGDAVELCIDGPVESVADGPTHKPFLPEDEDAAEIPNIVADRGSLSRSDTPGNPGVVQRKARGAA